MTSNSQTYLLMGGSNVEGASTCRYHQSAEDGAPGSSESKNRDVEIDKNLVVGQIPGNLKYLLEEVDGKSLNRRIKCTEELIDLIAPKCRTNSAAGGQRVITIRPKDACGMGSNGTVE